MTGSQLRVIRLALGLTLDAFGRALGYGAKRAAITASDLEAERATITPPVARLAEMYGQHGVPKRYLAD